MGKVTWVSEYAQTPNLLLNDKRITLKAKGLFGLMQSKAGDWNFSVNGLAYICKESKDAISSAIKELEEFGWLRRTKYQDSKGYWDIDYELFKVPTFDFPISENPTKENPLTENTINNKKKDRLKKDLKKKDKEEEKASTSFENSIPNFVLEEQKKITPHKAPPTFEEAEANMRESGTLRESVMRANKITDEYDYLNLLELFFLETKGNDKVLKSVAEHKRHFQSWARIAIEKGLQNQPKKGKIQQNYEDAMQAAQSIINKGNFKWKEEWE